MMSSGRRSLERGEEGRDLVGIVLAVRIEGHDRGAPGIEGVAEPGPQCRALAGVRHLAQDGRPGRARLGRGLVGRTVVDDDDRQVPAAPSTTAPIRGPSS